MDNLPEWLPAVAVLVAVIVVLAVLVVLRRARQQATPAGSRPRSLESLDTLASWTPERSRVLTSSERQAYAVLRKAVPDHMVLAQVPLARFLRVPTRNSYSEWMRRVGQLCADLVVCNNNSEVIAVIEIRQPPGQESERGVRRHMRMDRVLRAAGISLHVWREDLLPHPTAAREAILGAAAGLPPADASGSHALPARVAPVGMSAPVAGLPPGAVAARLATLEDELPHATELDDAHREPPPSTWFDDLDSASVPLDEAKRR